MNEDFYLQIIIFILYLKKYSIIKFINFFYADPKLVHIVEKGLHSIRFIEYILILPIMMLLMKIHTLYKTKLTN